VRNRHIIKDKVEPQGTVCQIIANELGHLQRVSEGRRLETKEKEGLAISR
jgi:hypothetical protein